MHSQLRLEWTFKISLPLLSSHTTSPAAGSPTTVKRTVSPFMKPVRRSQLLCLLQLYPRRILCPPLKEYTSLLDPWCVIDILLCRCQIQTQGRSQQLHILTVPD